MKIVKTKSLRYRMAAAAVLLSALPLTIAAFLSVAVATRIGEEELGKLAEQRMVAMRDSKKEQIEDYFTLIQDQLRTLSDDQMVVDAMDHFKTGYQNYAAEKAASPVEIESERKSLSEYYTREFAKRYEERNPDESAPVARLLERLSDEAVLLQYSYIQDNPNPLGSKHELAAAKDGSSYSNAHKKYHPKLRSFLEKFGYYDIFLVELETGSVVYSVFKELDFATSLRNGSYSETGLGKVFRAAADIGTPEGVILTDFAPYGPSYEDRAAFGASPIFDGNKKIGVLIFQMPVDRINHLMTYGGKWSGLGETGETYLVGPDKRLRSTSRALLENKEDYLVALKTAGVDKRTLALIDSKSSSIGLHPVKDAVFGHVRDGESGVALYQGYRGNEVMGAYSPLDIRGLKWSIFSEIAESEVMQANTRLRNELVVSTLSVMGLLILGAAVLGLYLARRGVGPILGLQTTIQKMEQDSDFSERVRIQSNDEIGAAGDAFNALAERIQRTIADIAEVTVGLGKGDLTCKLKEEYRGDFLNIQEGFEQALSGLNKVLRETTNVVDEVAGSAAELKDASQAVAAAAHEQSAAAHESLSALEETATMAEANANNAGSVTKLVAEAADAAANSQQQMEGMVTSMSEIDESSREIVRVVEVIDEIAFQTNLLSLNATVEAARAGKHGRGFAAVAQEVRNLAERSAKAARETNSLIRDSGEKVQRGVTMASATSKTLSGIVTSVTEVRSLVMEITAASKEQAVGLNEVRNAMQQVNSASQSSMEQSGRLAESSEQLTSLSTSLREDLGTFRLLPEGATRNGISSNKIGGSRESVPDSGVIPRTSSALGVSRTDDNTSGERTTEVREEQTVAAEEKPAAATRDSKEELSPAEILPLDEDERGYGTF